MKSTRRQLAPPQSLDGRIDARRAHAAMLRHVAWRRWLAWGTGCSLRIGMAVLGGVARLLRRSLDLAVAVSVVLLLSPVLASLAAFCKWSTGRVYRVTTVAGRRGRPFGLRRLSLPNNGWGRWLRRLGVAGLPVAGHVLRGDMSWIGPRPLPLGCQHLPGFFRRVEDRPGVVCLWWVRQQANIDYDSEWKADHEYIESRSFVADIAIGLRALWVGALGALRGPARCGATLSVLGIPIRNTSMQQAIDELMDILETDGPPKQATFVNADCVNIAQRRHDYQMCLQDVQWNYADGIGMKLAAQWLGSNVEQNINGTDMFPRLLSRLEEARMGIYLLGGEERVASDVADWIQATYPGVVVTGSHHGFLNTDADVQRVVAEIHDAGSDLLLVAMGAPRQELWIQQHLSDLDVRLAIGVGGLFDFYSGRRRRAPSWVRELGMEWVYRWWQEPRRLCKRYLWGNGLFLARVLWAASFRPGRSAHKPLTGLTKLPPLPCDPDALSNSRGLHGEPCSLDAPTGQHART